MAVLYEPIRVSFYPARAEVSFGMAFSICEVIRVATNCTLLTRQAKDFANAESHTRKKTSARRVVSFAADTDGKT